MSRNFKGRLARIEKAKPPTPFDWKALCGISPPENPDAEVHPGCGYTWAELAELPPQSDPLEAALAKLHAECPEPARLQGDTTEHHGLPPSASPVAQATRDETEDELNPLAPENDDAR